MRFMALSSILLSFLACDDTRIGAEGERTVELDDTLSEYCQMKQLFQAECVKCHSTNWTEQNASFLPMDSDEDIEAMLDGRIIIPEDSDSSILHQRMTNARSPMPPTGLLAEENWRVVSDWIDMDAPIETCED